MTAEQAPLLARLSRARAQTDRLFELVHPDSLYERPIAERHRIVFYIGHLEAFDWNLLQPRLPRTPVFEAALDRLFAFGIDPVDGGLPSDQPADWPALGSVHRYRDRVRTALDASLAATRFDDWSGEEAPLTLLNVAIEHRLMHAETLSYMLHQLPIENKTREPQVAVPESGSPRPESIRIPAGLAQLGLSRHDPDLFGWDNEYDAHTVEVPEFSIDRYKVTNRQYLEFLEAGGYQDRSLWTPQAWDWKAQHGIEHPVFWKRVGRGWLYRTMFNEIPLLPDWPVYVSYSEAQAYAQWAGVRLPTEAEWHRAALGVPEPAAQHGFFDFERWDPYSVNAFPGGRSAFGVEGLLANGWEWTSTAFGPFEGFQPFPFYRGYSADFFDGKHFVLKGGSTRTAGSMLRPSFRNWFQPHYQYVYAGFRCART